MLIYDNRNAPFAAAHPDFGAERCRLTFAPSINHGAANWYLRGKRKVRIAPRVVFPSLEPMPQGRTMNMASVRRGTGYGRADNEITAGSDTGARWKKVTA